MDQKLDIPGEFFRSANCLANDMLRANCWAKCQWTCFGYSSSREPPIEPKFFLELLTSYTHVFNTEARIFDHFLNFPNRANVLGLQNLSTIKNSEHQASEHVLGLIPILMSFCWVLILLFVFDLENIWIDCKVFSLSLTTS